MAVRYWIVVGDTTTSGGSVVAGSPFSCISGLSIARIGDPVVCGKHGLTTIVTGDYTHPVDGSPHARDGDFCACGCRLISTKQRLVFDDDGSAQGSAAGDAGSPMVTAAQSAASLADKPPICAECLSAGSRSGAPLLGR